jgi:hypothetical protein
MSQVVLLDNVEHHDLRLITHFSPNLGDAVNLALVVPTEFAEVQREYPILFRRSENGAFQAYALLGLETNENLYLDETGWQAKYIPAIQARGPFRIGFRKQDTGDGRSEPMIMVDLEHPRISRSEGEPLFLPHGGNAPAFERIAQTLRTLHAGVEMSNAMFAAFADAGLLAPVEINIEFDETTRYALPDFFSISEEALSQLGGETLQRLNQSGLLALAYCAVLSKGNLARLIELKSKRRQNS